MRILLSFLLTNCLWFLSPWATAASVLPESTRVDINVVLKVGDREQVFEYLVSQTQAINGYFSLRTDDELALRIPLAAIENFKDIVEGQGVLAGYTIDSQYYGDHLKTLESLIQAKRDLLAAYEETLKNSSNVGSVISVEKAMISLTEELETIINEKNNLEQQSKMATFHVSLQFRDRSAPHSRTKSSFPWLNELGLPKLLGDFK